MTPEREALEVVRRMIRDEPIRHSIVEVETMKSLGEVVDEALSAAPGEPCAVKPLEWRDHRPDSFPEPAWSAQTPFGFYNIEEVSASDSPAYVVRLHAHHFVADKDGLDEAKAAAQADYEQRIRSALVTTPQPAARWDALRANLQEAWFALALIRETVETLGPVGAMPASENLDGPTFMHEAEAIVQGIQLMALRREAPAPAEGVTVELEPWRNELSEIVGHLGAAIVQSGDKDDQIIMDHVKAAHEIAKVVRRQA